MKTIKIKEIKISNFGGVATASYTFDKDTNIIRSKKGSGKSSAYFAYLWALGFNVPSWEPKIEGYRLLKVKTEVFVTLDIDGVKYTIGKTNEPKYKINKFTAEEEYTGTNFSYFIDEQPLDATVYKDKIAELFGVDYFTLELLSNLSLFNNEDGKRWDKVERRKFLFKLFDLEGKIKELSTLPEFESIKEWLEKENDEIAINQILNKKKLDIDNEIKSSNVIMQEKMNEMQEYSYLDFEKLSEQKEALANEISTLEKNTFGENLDRVAEEKQRELQELSIQWGKESAKIADLNFDFNMRQLGVQKEISELTEKMTFSNSKLEKAKDKTLECQERIAELEESKFDESENICPLCKQPLPTETLSSKRAEFEGKKQETLKTLNLEYTENVNTVAEMTKVIDALKNQLEAKNGQLEFIKTEWAAIDKSALDSLKEKIEKVKFEIANIRESGCDQTVADKISELKKQYEETLIKISKKEELEKVANKINELKERIRTLGIMDSERITQKQALQKYIQKKVALVDESVNNSFEGVKYNFFKWLAAGSSKDFESICEAVLLETGGEYSSISSGEKVQADLYTNKSLRKILGVKLPQFIDDAVLYGFEDDKVEDSNWQTIYLVTDNNSKLPATLIRDVYTLNDCDIRK